MTICNVNGNGCIERIDVDSASVLMVQKLKVIFDKGSETITLVKTSAPSVTFQ